MTDRSRQPENESQDSLPTGLARDLRSTFAGRIGVPKHVDARIAAMARQAFVRQRRRRLLIGWVSGVTAVAAAIVLAVWLGSPAGWLAAPTPSAPPAQITQAMPALDRSRKIDILDAFALARRLERPGRIDESWDANGDGTVDRRDVEVLAARSVSLEERVVQ